MTRDEARRLVYEHYATRLDNDYIPVVGETTEDDEMVGKEMGQLAMELRMRAEAMTKEPGEKRGQ